MEVINDLSTPVGHFPTVGDKLRLIDPNRQELLTLITELSQRAPEQRLGQLVANLATLARGAKVEAVWDAEDDELAAAAKRLLDHYRQPAKQVS